LHRYCGGRAIVGVSITASFDMTEASNHPETSIADRRNARRQRSLFGAQIIFQRGNCAIPGHILNVSDTGAMVRPADIFSCPEKFTLKPRFDPPRSCEVVWRRGEMLGVRYV
jgi:hypothetical protein